MVGVTAPSNADSLFALLEFVQKPEFQDRVKELKEAENAANVARQLAESAKAMAEQTEARAKAEMEKLAELKQRLEGLPAREAALEAWIGRIQAALASKP